MENTAGIAAIVVTAMFWTHFLETGTYEICKNFRREFNQEAQLLLGWEVGLTIPHISEGQRLTSCHRKKVIFPSDYSRVHPMATLLYLTLQLINVNVRYSRPNSALIRRTWVICYRQQLCVQNCGQTVADRDMVTTDRLYRNSSSPYPIVSPTK